jgi:hypothetical protein
MPADAFVLTKAPARKFHGPGQQARRQFFASMPVSTGSSETCIRSRKSCVSIVGQIGD